jgi:hypothetical protein
MSLLSYMKEQMKIITADGKCLGRVAFVNVPDHIGVVGHRGLVPIKWVTRVNDDVYLRKTRQQMMSRWGGVEPDYRRLVQREIPGISSVADGRL